MTGARVRRVDRCIDRPPDYPSAAGAISAIPVLSVQRAGARLGTVPLVMRRSSVRFDRRLQVAAKNRTPPFDSVDRVVTGYARPGYRAVMAKTSKGHIQQLPSGSFRVKVYAGTDPVIGKERLLRQTCPDGASAHAALGRLLAEADGGRLQFG